MAQLAFDLTLEGAHRRVLVKITEIEDSTRRCLIAGGLNSITQAEAGALQRSLRHKLLILKSLWYAEPVGLASLGNWIDGIADEIV